MSSTLVRYSFVTKYTRIIIETNLLIQNFINNSIARTVMSLPNLQQWLLVELKLYFLSIFLEEDPDSSVARARHRQKRGLLKLYYGVGDEPGETQLILVMSTELTLDLMRTWKNY